MNNDLEKPRIYGIGIDVDCWLGAAVPSMGEGRQDKRHPAEKLSLSPSLTRVARADHRKSGGAGR